MNEQAANGEQGEVERLITLKAWVEANAADLIDGMAAKAPGVWTFIHAWCEAMVLGTHDTISAAEIALVELEADWEGK